MTMQVLGNAMMGFGALLGLFGLIFIWVPVFGLLCLAIGGGLWALGRFVRHQGRRQSVIKQQGGQGIF